MRWSLIRRLSLLGLAMGFVTVSWIPPENEGIFWLVIVVFSSWVIGGRARQHFFLHGAIAGFLAVLLYHFAHIMLFGPYTDHHMGRTKVLLAIKNPVPALAVGGFVQAIPAGIGFGLCAMLAGWLFRNRRRAAEKGPDLGEDTPFAVLLPQRTPRAAPRRWRFWL